MRCYVDMLLITSTANIKTWERDNGLYGGLSPLARGTLGIGAIAALCVRFIPADVGNSFQKPPLPFGRSVYPRWRGEHFIKRFCGPVRLGLSPLARGTQFLNLSQRRWRRFIPAGAGNTYQPNWASGTLAVYPRWRGEHRALLLVACVIAGLSPLARGTHTAANYGSRNARFIPAGAGNTWRPSSFKASMPVYPRWRGEHGVRRAKISAAFGLSPLARGTPQNQLLSGGWRRFIPAGAGNTGNARRVAGILTVYPRWRGEHIIRTPPRKCWNGLSPLARGTL